MCWLQLRHVRLLCLVLLSALALLPGLGSSGRLTYHEAFIAQGAREILNSNNWAYPTIGGLPWLEKPPLPWWLVAGFGFCTNGINETVARLPSAIAATVLVLGVAKLAAYRYGPTVGLLSGAVQATTAWTVMRGRLAEADILLACLITWTILAFDRIRPSIGFQSAESCSGSEVQWRRWRWLFFALLGVTGLVKGIGYGPLLILAVMIGVLIWERDSISFYRLKMPAGWLLATVICLSWPVFMIARHGFQVLSLWTVHVSGRLLPQQGLGLFASEPWWEYIPGVLAQALPWMPLTLLEVRRSLIRSVRRHNALCKGNAGIPDGVIAGDRLVLIWSTVPLGMLAMAPVRNAHYAISSQIPWSILAALALVRFGEQLRVRGCNRRELTQAAGIGFAGLALVYGCGFSFLIPRFERRGLEWAFYETAGRYVPVGMRITFLYDDWDRNPYGSPFGLIPHDLAVRFFYLGRVACWHMDADSLRGHDHTPAGAPEMLRPLCAGKSSRGPRPSPIAVIGRDRDLGVLKELGQIEVVARGPNHRVDRTYALFHITPITPKTAVAIPKQPLYSEKDGLLR